MRLLGTFFFIFQGGWGEDIELITILLILHFDPFLYP